MSEDTSSADEMPVPVVVLWIAVDAHASRGTAVDELEDALFAVYGRHDTHMVHPLSAAEEHQVAWQQFPDVVNLLALGTLLTRGTFQPDAHQVEDIAGETRAVESLGAAAATTVARAYQVFGCIDEVRGNGASQPCQQIGPHHRTHRRDNRCQLLLYIYRTDNGIGFREFYAMANGVIGK